MKKSMFLLCAFVLICAHPGVGFTSPVMVYDGVGGTWSDVNKVSVSGAPDSFLCWAAAASDVLAFTGWKGWDSGTSTYLDTAPKIYNKFVSAWPNQIGAATYAYEYWMTDRGQSIIPGGATFPTAGLNFYPGVNVQAGVGSVTAFVKNTTAGDIYNFLGIYINAHRGIVASIDVPQGPGTSGPYSHSVTVWGWDTAAELLYITDSDDGNTLLKTYSFFQSGGQVYIDNYTNLYTSATDVLITQLTRLNINELGIEPDHGAGPGPTVPLPPSMVLLGSGLLGLVGWRRFRKS
jgi:hypothetical protein